MDDKKLEDIKERLRSILAKAKDKGATESERNNALKFAVALMKKYSLTEESLKNEERGERTYHVRYRFQKILLSSLADLYMCVACLTDSSGYQEVFGKIVHLDQLEQIYGFMLHNINAEALAQDFEENGRSKRLNFKLGMAVRIAERAKAILEEERSKRDENTENALIVDIRKNEQEACWEQFGLIDSTKKERELPITDKKAFSLGKESGDKPSFSPFLTEG